MISHPSLVWATVAKVKPNAKKASGQVAPVQLPKPKFATAKTMIAMAP